MTTPTGATPQANPPVGEPAATSPAAGSISWGRRLSATTKLEILDRQEHVCPLCRKGMSGASAIEFDHELALRLGGADDPDNIVAVHRTCHRRKTDSDIGKIAKVRRLSGETGQRARRLRGATSKIPSRPFNRWSNP